MAVTSEHHTAAPERDHDGRDADEQDATGHDVPAGATYNDNLTCPACGEHAVHVISSNLGRVGPFSKPTRSKCAACGALYDYKEGEHEYIIEGDVLGDNDGDDRDAEGVA